MPSQERVEGCGSDRRAEATCLDGRDEFRGPAVDGGLADAASGDAAVGRHDRATVTSGGGEVDGFVEH